MSDASDPRDRDEVARVLRSINDCWLTGKPQEMAGYLHNDMAMVLPGFAGRVDGASAVIAGYEDFCNNAHVHEYEERDLRIDVYDNTAVASYTFQMVYEREGMRYSSSGRDLFVFNRDAGAWLAAWRTMLDIAEEPMS
ncbi:MAG: nuclear transport factor 2 family protein [Gemmatimonadota bacterium]|nr:MAG: nuclear transport factor 2 family protein [Gemmatimonadota bacterium]